VTRILACLAVVAGILILSAAQDSSLVTAQVGSSGSSIQQIDAYIEGVRQEVPIPGAAIAIVNSRGILYLQGYGEAAPGRGVTPQTPFWIASLSKPFTALAVRQLANAGKLDLDAPVQAYIPWFTLADADAAAQIRIRSLIEHTSGIPNRAGGELYYHAPASATPEDLVRALAQVMPNQTKRREYSNYNYILLGFLIEVVSGQTFEAYLREHVLFPLGMRHTHFCLETAQADGAAASYGYASGMPVLGYEPYKPAQQAGGYILASVEDMARFAMLYLNDGAIRGRNILGDPARQGPGYYDIYWQWANGRAGRFNPQHEGLMLTNNSAIRIYPDDNLAVVVLLNSRPDAVTPNFRAIHILDRVAGIVLAHGDGPWSLVNSFRWHPLRIENGQMQNIPY
jgi:CubicO group peptidase (beta-lactamase class C family)